MEDWRSGLIPQKLTLSDSSSLTLQERALLTTIRWVVESIGHCRVDDLTLSELTNIGYGEHYRPALVLLKERQILSWEKELWDAEMVNREVV